MPEAILYWLKGLRIKHGSSKSREFIDLEIIMLSEVSQRKINTILLICGL